MLWPEEGASHLPAAFRRADASFRRVSTLFVLAGRMGATGFVGCAGGFANTLRTRSARGAHELYEPPARKHG